MATPRRFWPWADIVSTWFFSAARLAAPMVRATSLASATKVTSSAASSEASAAA